MAIIIKRDAQIQKMRKAGKILALAHETAKKYIKIGITTGELDKIIEEFIITHDAKPTFKGYRGFPAAINASVNCEVIHGIPGLRKLLNGDIISIDIGVCYEGFNSDAARTYAVGEISQEAQNLIDATKQSFFEGIKYAKPEYHLNDISSAIESYATSCGYSMVREYCGHGIGRDLHEDPQIPNYDQKRRGPKLCKNLTFAIEPMVNLGKKDIEVLEDGWTVVTKDKKLSAHYENTILITDGEPDILSI